MTVLGYVFIQTLLEAWFVNIEGSAGIDTNPFISYSQAVPFVSNPARRSPSRHTHSVVGSAIVRALSAGTTRSTIVSCGRGLRPSHCQAWESTVSRAALSLEKIALR